jgi:hypothetical protein
MSRACSAIDIKSQEEYKVANPNERRGKNTAIRVGDLLRDAKTDADSGHGFFNQSWSEVAKNMGTAVGRPAASNMAKAAGGAALTIFSPPLAALAGTIVGSLSFVGDGMVDLVWGPIESKLWEQVDGDAMGAVRAKAGTDLNGQEILEELQNQLTQVVASSKALDEAAASSPTYCDDLYNLAFMFETMKKNIPAARQNAQSLRNFLDEVLKVLPNDAQIQSKEQNLKMFITAKLDPLPKHYDGAWVQGRSSMCSNTRCRGPA